MFSNGIDARPMDGGFFVKKADRVKHEALPGVAVWHFKIGATFSVAFIMRAFFLREIACNQTEATL